MLILLQCIIWQSNILFKWDCQYLAIFKFQFINKHWGFAYFPNGQPLNKTLAQFGNLMTEEIVPHPRYENPEPGKEITIPGDITKQNATDAVYAFYDSYTDQLLTCRKCNRKFYFFAKEQKYWYENLGFWVDARCVHCFECRLAIQKVKKLQKEYELLQKLKSPSPLEVTRFRVVAKTLIKIGCMKDRRKIKKLD